MWDSEDLTVRNKVWNGIKVFHTKWTRWKILKSISLNIELTTEFLSRVEVGADDQSVLHPGIVGNLSNVTGTSDSILIWC